jgi:hypothetical protein
MYTPDNSSNKPNSERQKFEKNKPKILEFFGADSVEDWTNKILDTLKLQNVIQSPNKEVLKESLRRTLKLLATFDPVFNDIKNGRHTINSLLDSDFRGTTIPAYTKIPKHIFIIASQQNIASTSNHTEETSAKNATTVPYSSEPTRETSTNGNGNGRGERSKEEIGSVGIVRILKNDLEKDENNNIPLIIHDKIGTSIEKLINNSINKNTTLDKLSTIFSTELIPNYSVKKGIDVVSNVIFYLENDVLMCNCTINNGFNRFPFNNTTKDFTITKNVNIASKPRPTEPPLALRVSTEPPTPPDGGGIGMPGNPEKPYNGKDKQAKEIRNEILRRPNEWQKLLSYLETQEQKDECLKNISPNPKLPIELQEAVDTAQLRCTKEFLERDNVPAGSIVILGRKDLNNYDYYLEAIQNNYVAILTDKTPLGVLNQLIGNYGVEITNYGIKFTKRVETGGGSREIREVSAGQSPQSLNQEITSSLITAEEVERLTPEQLKKIIYSSKTFKPRSMSELSILTVNTNSNLAIGTKLVGHDGEIYTVKTERSENGYSIVKLEHKGKEISTMGIANYYPLTEVVKYINSNPDKTKSIIQPETTQLNIQQTIDLSKITFEKKKEWIGKMAVKGLGSFTTSSFGMQKNLTFQDVYRSLSEDEKKIIYTEYALSNYVLKSEYDESKDAGNRNIVGNRNIKSVIEELSKKN